MTIHTCPRCELRFEREAEVADHLVSDHGVEPGSLERRPAPPPASTARLRLAVLANHTLTSQHLRDRIVELAGDDIAGVVLVAPTSDEDGLAMARWRADELAAALRAAGLHVDVEAHVADPVVALEQAIARGPVARVLVSTLPRGVSQWLEADLPGRLRHRLHVDVEVLESA